MDSRFRGSDEFSTFYESIIFGLEESGGTDFLVMELVEGITLAEHIAGNAGVLAGKNAVGLAGIAMGNQVMDKDLN